MLKDLVNKIKVQIDEEKNERVSSENILVGLLEDASIKICSIAKI